MRMEEYQRLAARTDVSSVDANQRHLILGLFGEAGSVLSVVKKKGRDQNSSKIYYEQATEEIGDLLWYVATAAERSGLSLGLIAKPLRLRGVRERKASEVLFADIQEPRKAIPLEPTVHLEWV